jgi:BACON domain-containing protein
VRVICCPNCQEPLPGTANFCAICGEYLLTSALSLNIPNENLDAPTIKLHRRSASLNLNHYLAINDDLSTITQSGGSQNAATLQRSSSNDLVPTSSARSAAQLRLSEYFVIDDELQSRANWEKVVTHKTSCVTPELANPLVVPEVYKPLLDTTSSALISVRRAPPKEPPRLSTNYLSWISIFILLCLVLGGVFGLAVSYGRGILDQASHNVFALKVTPLNAAIGGIITLHGTAFSPNVKVGLTRDANITLIDTGGTNIIHADSHGSFSDTVIVDPSWGAGSHIIHAEDAILHKSASFTVFVTGQGISLRPSHLLFSPNVIDLGSGDQAMNTTKIVTLSNTGSGQIKWQATTAQSWLLISPKSGTLSFNQKMNVEVAADRSNLRVGAYAAGLVFLANSGQATLPVKMIVTQLQPGHRAILQLTPALLSFTGIDGSANPLSQVVTVSNPGVLPLQWSATSATNDGSSWLSMYPPSGTVTRGSSQAVTISVNTSTMLPGVYNGSITFASHGAVAAKDSPQTIVVSLVITPQFTFTVGSGTTPIISAAPATVALSGIIGQFVPLTQTITITNPGGGTLAWHASAATTTGGAWLAISQTSGTISPHSSSLTTVIGTMLGTLTAGTYTGTVAIAAIDSVTKLAVGTPMVIPVTLTVQPVCSLQPPSSPAMNFLAQAGLNPAPQTFTVGVIGACAGNVTITPTATLSNGTGWLAVSAPITVISGGSAIFTVNIASAGLAAGKYTGSISLTALNGSIATSGSPQVVGITLNVLAAPALTTGPGSVVFNVSTGIVLQPITITNSGGSTLNWTAALGAGAPGYVSLSAKSGANLAGGNTASINVLVDATGLAGGTSVTTSVIVSAIDPPTGQPVSGSPVTVTVTINIPPPEMLLSVTSLAFTTTAGTNPAAQTVNVQNPGGNTLTWTVSTPSQPWLIVSPTTGSDSAGQVTPITFNVNVTGLTAGTYPATVVITPSVGAPVTVNVALTIN